MGLRVEEAFREIDFGLFEGLTYEEAERRFPGRYAEWMAHPEQVRFPEERPIARCASASARRPSPARHQDGASRWCHMEASTARCWPRPWA